jgi:hypothetical protein
VVASSAQAKWQQGRKMTRVDCPILHSRLSSSRA